MEDILKQILSQLKDIKEDQKSMRKDINDVSKMVVESLAEGVGPYFGKLENHILKNQ